MAYSNENSPGPAMGAEAGDELEKPGAAPAEDMEHGGDGGDGEGTFFLPPDFCEGHDCQPGDKITLEVVNKDKDGDVEVRMSHDNGYGRKGGEMSMMDDLRASKDKIMPAASGPSGGM